MGDIISIFQAEHVLHASLSKMTEISNLMLLGLECGRMTVASAFSPQNLPASVRTGDVKEEMQKMIATLRKVGYVSVFEGWYFQFPMAHWKHTCLSRGGKNMSEPLATWRKLHPRVPLTLGGNVTLLIRWDDPLEGHYPMVHSHSHIVQKSSPVSTYTKRSRKAKLNKPCLGECVSCFSCLTCLSGMTRPPPCLCQDMGNLLMNIGTQMLFAFRCSEPLVDKKRDPWKMIPNLFLKV